MGSSQAAEHGDRDVSAALITCRQVPNSYVIWSGREQLKEYPVYVRA